MHTISRKGWIVRTALRVGREFFEHFNEGEPRSERRSEIEMRALIEARLNFCDRSLPDVDDNAQEGEIAWTFRERGPHGLFTGSHVRFLAPNIYAIHSIRQRDAEKARISRQAKKQRAEIRRALTPARRVANLPDPVNLVARLNDAFQSDDPHGGDRHREGNDAPIEMPMPMPAARRRSGAMRL